MKRHALYLVAASAVLAGCNHSGSSTSTASVAPTTVTTTAPVVSAMRGGTTALAGQDVELIAEGDTVRLAYAQGGPVVYTDPDFVGPGTAYDTRTGSYGTMTAYRNGAERLRVIEGQYARLAIAADDDADRTHMVAHGAIDPAAPAPMGLTGTATYSGIYSGQLKDTVGDYNVEGDVSLTADFDASTISGRIDGIKLASGGTVTATDATIELTGGIIAGSTYNGVATVTREGNAWNTVGPTGRERFEGEFHGDQAQETVGTVTVVGTDPVLGESHTIGGFMANRQP